MIKIRAPGRICLFGEHQDYLGYPIISLAISKYIYLESKRIGESKFIVNLPDINERLEIKLNGRELDYRSHRDYIVSGYNHFLRKGAKFHKGYEIKITGDIPINAGVASSSALVIAWLYFLNLISEQNLNPFELSITGYEAEVKEFGEGGGMMDHFSAIYGNLIYLEQVKPIPNLLPYDLKLNGFILGNSLEKKNTVDDLIRLKKLSLESFSVLKSAIPNFDPYNTKIEEIITTLPSLKKQYSDKIIGNLMNRDITHAAKILIENYYNKKIESNKFYKELGVLLSQHHMNLKERIKISTKKIDQMIANSIKVGALGGKINGSGFGGTMFVLTLGNETNLTEVIESFGGEAFILNTSNGVEIY
jgi:galactokinase